MTDTTEHDYYPQMVQWLRIEGCHARSQVPMMCRLIDVVAVTGSGEVWAFEVKLEHWRRGLKQAELCLLGADRAYLAVPSDLALRISEEPSDLIAEGIGLVALCPGGPQLLLAAEQSMLTVAKLRDQVREAVLSG